MLVLFIFVLSVVTTNGESIKQDGLRKSRQLDLGLQDIRTDDGELTTIQEPATPTEQDIIDGYLPPASSDLSPPIVGAQSQQAFDFKSVNFLEKESELCKPPFDRESCDPKESSTSDSIVSEPSRELVPPLNNLDKDVNIKAITTLEPKTEETKPTEDQKELIATTLVTKIFKALPTQSSTGITTTKTQVQVSANKAEATNELKSYLPPQPEFSAAAQTNIAITRPPNQHNDHHDHHHLHDENFNICTDAFHSFLCAPLKARKRITGALPSNLLGSSSYINYQKTLAKFDKETAPSNEYRNEYLPPKPSPSNLIQSTYSSFPTKNSNVFTTTTTTAATTTIAAHPRKVFYKPSTSNGKIQNTVYVKSAPINQATDLTAPSSATSLKNYPGAVSNSLLPKIPVVYSTSGSQPNVAEFSSLSSNENSFYLPPKTNSQNSASFKLTSENSLPIISTVKPSPPTLISLPAVTTFSPLFSNSIFSSQKPKQVFTTTSKPFTTVKTSATVLKVQTPSLDSLPSDNTYLPPSSELTSYFKSSTSTLKPTLSTFKFSEQYSNTDSSYLPPDFKKPAAAQISSTIVSAPQGTNPFHHGRDLCTDPFHSFLCSSSKPRKRITGQLPLGFKTESSNTDETRVKSEPFSQHENKNRFDKPLETAPAQNLGYTYPKPTNSLPSNVITSTQQPSTGYVYSLPDKIFSLPSQQDVKVASPSQETFTTKKPVSTFRPSEASDVSGYQYTKPDKIFSLPAGQENTRVTQTTTKTRTTTTRTTTTTTRTPTPTSTTTNTYTTGYSYPKPQKPFPLPSEQTEVRQKTKPKTPSSLSSSSSVSTNQVRGYQYPKPDQSLKLPEKKGYSYPKPEKRLELPTENLSKSFSTLPQNNFNLDNFGQSGSAEFIPVNKIEYKRAEPSKLLMGLRRFGERMKKRERQAQLLKRQFH